jgi:hypothetical protein
MKYSVPYNCYIYLLLNKRDNFTSALAKSNPYSPAIIDPSSVLTVHLTLADTKWIKRTHPMNS